MAQMRETKIRFSERLWQTVQEEARAEGVSASQFVREAALMRAVFTRYERNHPQMDVVREMYAEMHRLLGAEPEDEA